MLHLPWALGRWGCTLLWEETWEALPSLWLVALTSEHIQQHKNPLQGPGPHSRHQTQQVLGHPGVCFLMVLPGGLWEGLGHVSLHLDSP